MSSLYTLGKFGVFCLDPRLPTGWARARDLRHRRADDITFCHPVLYGGATDGFSFGWRKSYGPGLHVLVHFASFGFVFLG